jgi:poly(ADP-ribose) glycohydrolase ARH3
MENEILESKFLGSMVGTAVGDALGAPFEGWWGGGEKEIEDRADKQSTLQYTDDTHMMIGVAQSLIEKKGFDGQHMAHTFIQNYDREPYRGYGPGPPRIFRSIKSGEAWDKAAEKSYPGGSYGNGAAMRIAPIGLFYYDNPAELKEIAHLSSQITHAHDLGKEGAALQAYAVALAASLDPSLPFQPASFLEQLNHFMQHELYLRKLKEIERLLGEVDKLRVASELGNGVDALNSVPAAIYSFLSHPDSFEKSTLYAISLGGDSDTIGAMTGAISGAYLGIQAIPDRWEEKLENRAYLEELAEELWEIKAALLAP